MRGYTARMSALNIMELDDSFFEDQSEREGKKRKERETTKYTAKVCTPEWFVKATGVGGTEDEDHVTLKYQADLLYHRGLYQEAGCHYSGVLEALPPSNTVVKREGVDSLARCSLQQGAGRQAVEYARKLVAPPHDSDASSWQLLGLCHKCSGHTEDWMLCLQRSVSFQRHHYSSWLELSEAFCSLCSLCYRNPETTFSSIFSNTEAIISNTVALFRPYFNWGRILTPDSVQEVTAHHRWMHTVAKGLKSQALLECEESLQHGSKHGNQGRNWTELSGETNDKVGPTKQEYPLTFPSASHHYGDGEEEEGTMPSSAGHVSGHHETLARGWTGCNGVLCSEEDLSAVAEVMGRNISVEEFMENLSRGRGCRLLGVLFHVASCCCLIWARQLLLYSVRHSNSFAKDAQQAKLTQVEHLIAGYHDNLTHHLLQCFNKSTIFEDKMDK